MLTIGTRGSTLALVQTTWVKERILGEFPGTRIRIKVISTSADRNSQASIRSGSATGVFVKEIEDALADGKIDLAVHSMKDLPTRVPDALTIAAIPLREDPRDALITNTRLGRLQDLPPGAAVGTGSIRRQAQLLAVRPDLKIQDIRGNVDTRMRKMASGECYAIVLACAGLKRLGLQDGLSLPLDRQVMLPAAGQGALAIEIRKDDPMATRLVAPLNHPRSAVPVHAERAFMRHIGGGCNSPIAVYAWLQVNDQLAIDALVATPDGTRIIRDSLQRPSDSADEAAATLADRLLRNGGKAILEAAP